jgi:uncharacterized MAPEG superfamily protein
LTTPLYCLLGFAAWTLLLVVAVISWRSLLVLARRKRANEFTGGVKHGEDLKGGDLYWRLNRAHMNSVENLAVFATIVLVGHLAGVRSGTLSLCAEVMLAARIVQSVTHIASGSVRATYLRFSAFSVQVASMALMILEVFTHA